MGVSGPVPGGFGFGQPGWVGGGAGAGAAGGDGCGGEDFHGSLAAARKIMHPGIQIKICLNFIVGVFCQTSVTSWDVAWHKEFIG